MPAIAPRFRTGFQAIVPRTLAPDRAAQRNRRASPGSTPPSGSAATSPATRACSAWLYATTGGQAPGGASELTPAQAVKKFVAAARAAAGRVQHLAVDDIVALQCFEPLRSTACALG